MKYKIKLPDGNWRKYKSNVVATTDYKKFEDMLKMIIDGNREQTEQLTRYLEEQGSLHRSRIVNDIEIWCWKGKDIG